MSHELVNFNEFEIKLNNNSIVEIDNTGIQIENLEELKQDENNKINLLYNFEDIESKEDDIKLDPISYLEKVKSLFNNIIINKSKINLPDMQNINIKSIEQTIPLKPLGSKYIGLGAHEFNLFLKNSNKKHNGHTASNEYNNGLIDNIKSHLYKEPKGHTASNDYNESIDNMVPQVYKCSIATIEPYLYKEPHGHTASNEYNNGLIGHNKKSNDHMYYNNGYIETKSPITNKSNNILNNGPTGSTGHPYSDNFTIEKKKKIIEKMKQLQIKFPNLAWEPINETDSITQLEEKYNKLRFDILNQLNEIDNNLYFGSINTNLKNIPSSNNYMKIQDHSKKILFNFIDEQKFEDPIDQLSSKQYNSDFNKSEKEMEYELDQYNHSENNKFDINDDFQKIYMEILQSFNQSDSKDLFEDDFKKIYIEILQSIGSSNTFTDSLKKLNELSDKYNISSIKNLIDKVSSMTL